MILILFYDMQASFLCFLLFLSKVTFDSFVSVSGLLNPVIDHENPDLSRIGHMQSDHIAGYRTRTNDKSKNTKILSYKR